MRERILTRDEALRGWDRFWSKNQVKEFLRTADGKYARDKAGNLVAIRTDEKRKLPQRKFDFRRVDYGITK